MFGLRGTEVILLLVLCHVGKNGPSLKSVESCDRHSSAIVRHVVHTKLQPVLQRYRIPMPEDCPFHPSRDVLVWPKRSSTTDIWKCPVCGRSFFGEENLTEHYHKHQTLKRHFSEGDRVCLGSYCDIMRCDVVERTLSKDTTSPTVPKQRETCKDPSCRCDPSKMAVLENKCKVVMQQCTLGLLNVLSVKEYKDIEDELYRNICSYLRCDRYWHDSVKETRNISPFFASIAGFILATGFFTCYYIVWVVFDYTPLPEEAMLHKLPNGTTIRRVSSTVTISRQNSAPIGSSNSIHSRHPNSHSYPQQREVSAPSEAALRRHHSHTQRGRQHPQHSRYHYERPLRSPLKAAREYSPVYHSSKEHPSTVPRDQDQRRPRAGEFEKVDDFEEDHFYCYYPLDNAATLSTVNNQHYELGGFKQPLPERQFR